MNFENRHLDFGFGEFLQGEFDTMRIRALPWLGIPTFDVVVFLSPEYRVDFVKNFLDRCGAKLAIMMVHNGDARDVPLLLPLHPNAHLMTLSPHVQKFVQQRLNTSLIDWMLPLKALTPRLNCAPTNLTKCLAGFAIQVRRTGPAQNLRQTCGEGTAEGQVLGVKGHRATAGPVPRAAREYLVCGAAARCTGRHGQPAAQLHQHLPPAGHAHQLVQHAAVGPAPAYQRGGQRAAGEAGRAAAPRGARAAAHQPQVGAARANSSLPTRASAHRGHVCVNGALAPRCLRLAAGSRTFTSSSTPTWRCSLRWPRTRTTTASSAPRSSPRSSRVSAHAPHGKG